LGFVWKSKPEELMMKLRYWKTGALIATASAGMGCWYLAGCPVATLHAEDFGFRAGPNRGPDETVDGRVKTILRNDRDDIDGLSLEDGKEIHFPPHLGESVTRLVQVGDNIKVTGNQETRPRGEVVFEASLIEKGTTSMKIERPEPPRGPKPPHRRGPGAGPRDREEAMNATGAVKEFATNRRGDVDGLFLADGTEVKLPPHQGRELQALVQVGQEVRIEGRRHVTPHGDVHLHADRITAVASGASIERDGPPGPGPRPRDSSPEARPAPPGPTAKQFDEILNELRELRRLLEAQKK
jgi:hypothetical protein